MPLVELRQKKVSNSEAYSSESDALLPSYPQVLLLRFYSANVFFTLKFYINEFSCSYLLPHHRSFLPSHLIEQDEL